MNAEDIKMGEWYKYTNPNRQKRYDGKEYTPLSVYCDREGDMVFRERVEGLIYRFQVSLMKPTPELVVYLEQWLALGKGGVHQVCGSLEVAQYWATRSNSAIFGILHVRTDGTTKMLEIES